MDSSTLIEFGVIQDYVVSFGSSYPTSIYPLNHRECFASTTKELCRFERKNVKMKYKYQFAASILVPGTEFLIGVTAKFGKLMVLRTSDLSEPLIDDFHTDQHGIFHMIYSPKSRSVITIGSGICVFTFDYDPAQLRISILKPNISLKRRSRFADNYDTTILVPPPFDPEREVLLLPTPNGITPYTLDGKPLEPYSIYPADIKTVYTFNHQTQKLLLYDSNEGMTLWNSEKNLLSRFSTAGSSVVAMIFVDNENVVCLNSYNSLFFLNIETGRTFHCITLSQKPSRLFLIDHQYQKYLFVCCGTTVKAMKLVIPWFVWNLNLSNPLRICRCDQFNHASRILVSTDNSFVKFYSPKDGQKLAVATPSLAVNAVSFLYDRGLYERYVFNEEKKQYSLEIMKTTKDDLQRDNLFVILEDGRVVGFNTSVSLCEQTMSKQCKAALMTLCKCDDEWCYALASENSDLYIYSYNDFKEIYHFTIVNDKLQRMFYHYESDCIVMVLKRETLLYDIKKGKIIDQIRVNGNKVTELFGNMLKYGYDSGYIAQVNIVNRQLVPIDIDNMQRPHSDTITCFSFSAEFWISMSLDGKIIYWDYNMMKMFQITFPLPLQAGLIMNGKRDILAATDTEVMIIKGSFVFDSNELDKEIPEVDNFDKLADNLSRDVVFPIPKNDETHTINNAQIDDEEYSEYSEYDNEETTLPIEKNPNISKPNDSPQVSETVQSNETEQNNPKSTQENAEKDIEDKLEKMKAINGIKNPLPAVLMERAEKDKEKYKSPSDKIKAKAKIAEKKSASDFIADSIQQEKEKQKRIKKVKKVKNEPTEQPPPEEKVEKLIKQFELFPQETPTRPAQGEKEMPKENIDIAGLAMKFAKKDEPIKLPEQTKMEIRLKKDDEYDNDYVSDGDTEEEILILRKEKPEKEAMKKRNLNTEKESKVIQETKPPLEPKTPKDSKPSKESEEIKTPKELKQTKEPKVPKESKPPKLPKPEKDSKPPNESKESKSSKEVKQPKEKQEAKIIKEPKPIKEPSVPKTPKVPKESNPVQQTKKVLNLPKDSIPPKSPEEPKKPKEPKTPKLRPSTNRSALKTNKESVKSDSTHKESAQSKQVHNESNQILVKNTQPSKEKEVINKSSSLVSIGIQPETQSQPKETNKNEQKKEKTKKQDAKTEKSHEKIPPAETIKSLPKEEKKPTPMKKTPPPVTKVNSTKSNIIQSPPPPSNSPLDKKTKPTLVSTPPKTNKVTNPLAGKRPRCPSPPLIRWNAPNINYDRLNRPRTPPMRNRPLAFTMPPPNIVLDKTAILYYYGRGAHQLKPLVDLLEDEKEYAKINIYNYQTNRISDSPRSSFEKLHQFPESGRFTSRNRYFNQFNEEMNPFNRHSSRLPLRPTYFGHYFFNDDDDKVKEFGLSGKTKKQHPYEMIPNPKAAPSNLPSLNIMTHALPIDIPQRETKLVRPPLVPEFNITLLRVSQQQQSPRPMSTRIPRNIPDNSLRSSRLITHTNFECSVKENSSRIEQSNNRNLTQIQNSIIPGYGNRIASPNTPAMSKSKLPSIQHTPRVSVVSWNLFPQSTASNNNKMKDDLKVTNHYRSANRCLTSRSPRRPVDLLESAVMSKIPKLDIPTSSRGSRKELIHFSAPRQLRPNLNPILPKLT